MLTFYSLVARKVTVAICRTFQYDLQYKDRQKIEQIEVTLSRNF